MFLCNRCHNANNHPELFRSLGACEACGTVTSCIDCHLMECTADDTTKPRRLKGRHRRVPRLKVKKT